ncbi:MAG TPA: glycosyltransferase [Verrucomicrobiae bacterium]
MKISIVVPAFNEERLLGESLSQIKGAASSFVELGWATELIVCDNNSTDRTAEIASAGGAKVIFEPVNQIARARNTGASVATGDWIVFVDADSHPSAGLFADVAREIQSGRCIAGGSTVRLDEDHFAGGLITRLWNLISRRLRLLAGSFIFCEAATFREVSGFSNELFAAEELELSMRLKKRAKKTGKRLVILNRHPLVTSARKMKLYTFREHFRFLVFVLFSKRRALASREAAHLWYDGRR